jgi:ABC-type multidrug transport system fused ATPase/permease subunit
MSLETVAEHTLYRQIRAPGGDLCSLAGRALLKRIWDFAARHHRRLGGFVTISVVSALLAVVTPLLAGKVLDQIIRGGAARSIVLLALVIAAVALAEAAVSLVTRWLSSTIGEGLILDLHTAVFDHVAAHARGVLHPHPGRRSAGNGRGAGGPDVGGGMNRHGIRLFTVGGLTSGE